MRQLPRKLLTLRETFGIGLRAFTRLRYCLMQNTVRCSAGHRLRDSAGHRRLLFSARCHFPPIIFTRRRPKASAGRKQITNEKTLTVR